MTKSLLAFAVAAWAAIVAPEARATTFPALTTIYYAAGAVDNSAAGDNGVATVISCSNLSGQNASVRYFYRDQAGTIVGSATLSLGNLAERNVVTQGGIGWLNAFTLVTGNFFGGTIQVLSTQSAVYCSAMLVRADGQLSGPSGVALHMVRLNPHPGTVE